jgi:hypothetical protein
LCAYQPLTLDSLIDTLARQGTIYTESKFTKSTLRRLLHSRSYIGEVKYRDIWHTGSFEPPVDQATFQTVQDKFGTNFKVYRSPELTFATGLLTVAQ